MSSSITELIANLLSSKKQTYCTPLRVRRRGESRRRERPYTECIIHCNDWNILNWFRGSSREHMWRNELHGDEESKGEKPQRKCKTAPPATLMLTVSWTQGRLAVRRRCNVQLSRSTTTPWLNNVTHVTKKEKKENHTRRLTFSLEDRPHCTPDSHGPESAGTHLLCDCPLTPSRSAAHWRVSLRREEPKAVTRKCAYFLLIWCNTGGLKTE